MTRARILVERLGFAGGPGDNRLAWVGGWRRLPGLALGSALDDCAQI